MNKHSQEVTLAELIYRNWLNNNTYGEFESSEELWCKEK